jgi:hypothetical protein
MKTGAMNATPRWLGRPMCRCMALGAALALLGCADDPRLQGPTLLEGQLELELRDSATVRITPKKESAQYSITLSAGFGFVPAGTTIEADGFIDALPEASATLYHASASITTEADGPCGGGPALARLSLHRQGSNAMVVGGLAIYCGESVGVPQRILRLAGDLPLP